MGSNTMVQGLMQTPLLKIEERWMILNDLEDGIGERMKIAEGKDIRPNIRKHILEATRDRLALYAALAYHWGVDPLSMVVPNE